MKLTLGIHLAIFFLFTQNVFAAERKISISGSQTSWIDTGIILNGKFSANVKAKGTINYCGGASQCNATPDGSVSGEAHCGGGSTDAGGALCGALIGRVGGVSGITFVIGTGLTIPIDRIGRLELGIQDFKFDDNSGSFVVTISGIKKEKYDLSGYLLGSAGLPFPNELVYATGGGKRYKARTDADGRYQFSELPKGNYTVAAERTMRFPKTFTPIDGELLNFAFSPRRLQVSLTTDLSNQNFTARQFQTIKAPMRTVRKTVFNSKCDLKPAIESGATAQVSGIQRGTKLRMVDSFFAGGFIVTVIGDGPFDDAKFRISGLECVGIKSKTAGIGLPLNSGGAEDGGTALIELAPKG